MLAFMFGVLMGFVVGYMIGVWAGHYTEKAKNDNR